MIKLKIACLTALLLGPLSILSAAELKLAGVFTDHTVLQRDKTVTIWGWADPNEPITVKFASQSKPVTADASGRWQVRLDPMPASAEGRELVVESTLDHQKASITDVVVGDVWLCSGQSNMHFQMKSDANAASGIAASENPSLRFFTVEHQFGQRSLPDSKGAWMRTSPETTGTCSAVAYYFGKELQRKLGVPVGLIVSSVGGTRIETWMRSETLAATGESKTLIEKWGQVSAAEFEKIGAVYSAFQRERDQVHPQAVKVAKAKGEPAPPAPVAPKQRCHDSPSALHNGMISPLQPYAIRGAIWYQGESNSGQPGPYEKLLPAMIADWRQVWGDGLPFLFVQLAPYRDTHPGFREAQFRIWQTTPRTAMVVTTDVGDASNIHPTRKGPVGERLALAARALAYEEKIESSGPVFESIKAERGKAIITFTHVGSGLMAREGELKGFTVAGSDGKFLPARAVIEGSTVIVTSEKVPEPVSVRFGWAMVPEVNLFNREGLPAVPFRTDLPSGQKDVKVTE